MKKLFLMVGLLALPVTASAQEMCTDFDDRGRLIEFDCALGIRQAKQAASEQAETNRKAERVRQQREREDERVKRDNERVAKEEARENEKLRKEQEKLDEWAKQRREKRAAFSKNDGKHNFYVRASFDLGNNKFINPDSTLAIAEPYGVGYSYNFHSGIIAGIDVAVKSYTTTFEDPNIDEKKDSKVAASLILGYRSYGLGSFVPYLKIGSDLFGLGFEYQMLSWLSLYGEIQQVDTNNSHEEQDQASIALAGLKLVF